MSIFAQVIGGPASPSYHGAALTADLNIGDTVLHVDDVADFDEDAAAHGGAVMVALDLGTDGMINPTSGTVLSYLTCDDEADTITLAVGSTVAMLSGDWVYIQNPVTGLAVGETEVMVMLDDADETGDALMVSIDTSMLGGYAYPDLTNHAVELDEDEDGQLVVRNLPGLAQALGSYVGNPATDAELAQLQADLADNDAALAQAQRDIAANQTAVSSLNGKFPIVTTDITPGAITTPTMSANNINGDRILGNTLDAGKIVAGTITTDRMTANTINGDRITTNTLNADRIVANSITGDKIQANSISTAQLSVGVGTNFLTNPGFETGTVAPHQATGGAQLLTRATNLRSGLWTGQLNNIPVRAAGSYGYILTFGGASRDISTAMPVRGGDVVHGEFWVRINNGIGITVQAYLDLLDSTGTLVTNVNSATSTPAAFPIITVSATYQLVQVEYVVPAASTAAYATLNVAVANTTTGASILIDDALLTRQITGQLIVNGSITGHTITGGLIQTAASGTRVEMTANSSNYDKISFYSGAAAETAPPYVAVLSNSPYLNLVSGTTTTQPSTASLQLVPGKAPGVGTPLASVSATGLLFAPTSYNDTGGTTANVFFASDGHFARITSVASAKREIRPMTMTECRSLLAVEPTTFYDRGQWERNDESYDGLLRIPGVTAEDVEQVAPLFATYDDDGLSGVSYDRMGVALIPLVRDLYDRLEVLTARVAELEGKA